MSAPDAPPWVSRMEMHRVNSPQWLPCVTDGQTVVDYPPDCCHTGDWQVCWYVNISHFLLWKRETTWSVAARVRFNGFISFVLVCWSSCLLASLCSTLRLCVCWRAWVWKFENYCMMLTSDLHEDGLDKEAKYWRILFFSFSSHFP